jgi:hypothetical protein
MKSRRHDDDVTTYEWAVEAFDNHPERPSRLEPGKRPCALIPIRLFVRLGPSSPRAPARLAGGRRPFVPCD